MTALRRWRIKLPYEVPPLTLNKSKSMHWAPKAKVIKELRELAFWQARSHKIPPLDRVRVMIEWRVPDKRKRDVDNPVETVKPLADGLVDAGVVPDDSWQYMEGKGVEIVYDKGVRELFLTIEELG